MIRRLIALSLLAVGCQNSASPVAPIAGMATLRVHIVAEPKAGAPQSDAAVSSFDTPTARNNGAFAKVDYADLSQIVVWIEPVDGSPEKSEPAPLELSLRDPAPPDSVTGVAEVGQPIVLKNTAASPRTIYSVSDGNEFNLGSIAPGASGQAVAKSAGTIEVLAESSPDPLAVIEVAPTQWVKMAHAGDDVTFANLPPGNYRVVSWHPRLPGSQTTVQLAADQVTETQIRVGVNALPKVGPIQTP